MFFLFFLIWIMLNSAITTEIIIIGIVISTSVYILSYHIFGYGLRKDIRLLKSMPLIMVYAVVVLIEIIKANISVIYTMYNRRIKPDPILITFHSGLLSDTANAVLANSITLTPGTITVRQEGDFFYVHCLRSKYGEGIENSVFVKILRKLEKIK